MSLLAMLKKGGLRQSATAIPATFATDTPSTLPKVARVATVAVANLQTPAANDPTPATTVSVTLPTPDGKGLPTTPADGFRNSDENTDTDPDRWCWPHSTAMTGSEIDLFAQRLARFTTKGVIQSDAESIADKLVIRDREAGDRRLCLECTHLGGYGRTSWRCNNWQRSGIAIRQRDNQLPAELVQQLQRCDGFAPTT